MTRSIFKGSATHRVWLMLFLLSAPSFAAGPEAHEPRDLAPLLQPILRQHDLPGMVALTIEGDRVVASGAVGVRRRGSEEKITLADQIHLGSDTKAMTATLCAMLVEDGGLSWNSTLGEVFPGLRPKMHADYRGVTVEQLLTNHGGCPGDLNPSGLWPKLWAFHGSPVAARHLLLEGVVTLPPGAAPGTRYLYSNAGFAIAGHMAETVMHRPWEELLRERLFRPLEMNSAGFGAPGRKEALDQPRGHAASGEPVEPGPAADNPAAIGPAGIVHCSLPDWAKFVAFHVTNGRGHPRLLKPESFAKLHTPFNSDAKDETEYAMGWIVADRGWGGGRVLTHAGSNTMWYAVAWLAPKRDFAVLIATNQGGDKAAAACDQAASAMIQEHANAN